MKKVLITREANQFNEIKELFISHNLYPISFPVIKFSPVEFEFDESRFDYLIFTSSNGVKFFFNRYRPVKPKIIAVGEKTAKVLREEGYTDIIIPPEYSSEGVLNYISQHQEEFIGSRVGLVRAVEGMDTLISKKPEYIQVELIKVYKTEYNIPQNKDEIRHLLEKTEIDFVVFSSPSTVEGFLNIFPDGVDLLKKVVVGVIGKTTRMAAEEKGIKVDIIPSRYTFEELAVQLSRYT